MVFQDRRFWVLVNALLATAMVIVVGCIFIIRWRGPEPLRPAGEPARPAVRRLVDAGRVDVRPVAYAAPAVADVSGGLRMRGVLPQEWARLPPSPGMDTAEMPDGKGYLLTFSLPGVRGEDVQLTMTGSVVTVQALVRDADGNRIGGMERRVWLPQLSGTPGEYRSFFSNGFLCVVVPK
jgi:HSP20 family molecular chaperone IbpA